jgi:hypothetical protein
MIGCITAGLFSAGVAPSTNAYASIATVTVGAGGSSTITFSSIPSTYKHLQIRALSRGTDAGTGGTGIRMRFNADTGSNYSWHLLTAFQGASGGVSAGSGTSQTGMLIGEISMAGNAGSIFTASITDIFEYSNTNIYKTTKSLSGYDINGSTSGYNYLDFTSSNWRSTSAVSQIDIFCQTGSFAQYTQFALYGIKG